MSLLAIQFLFVFRVIPKSSMTLVAGLIYTVSALSDNVMSTSMLFGFISFAKNYALCLMSSLPFGRQPRSASNSETRKTQF